MTDEPIKMKHGAPGDPMFDACFDVMDTMRDATAAFVIGQPDLNSLRFERQLTKRTNAEGACDEQSGDRCRIL